LALASLAEAISNLTLPCGLLAEIQQKRANMAQTGPVEAWLEQVLISKVSNAPTQPSVVTFCVGGEMFQILEQTILSRGDTLLSDLLGDPEHKGKPDPIYVEGDKQRFRHILDWYRFGSICIPHTISVDEMRKDCDFYKLPDTVSIKREGLGQALSSINASIADFTSESDQLSVRAAAHALVALMLKEPNLMMTGQSEIAFQGNGVYYPNQSDHSLVCGVLLANGSLHQYFGVFKEKVDVLAQGLGFQVTLTSNANRSVTVKFAAS